MSKLFPVVLKRQTVIFAGSRDISYVESFDIGDDLSGTLGPVQTQETVDISDQLAADLGPVQIDDSINIADVLEPVTAPQFVESVDIADQLAGTLGPVAAQDSVDIADTFVADNLTLTDSVDITDATHSITAPQFLDSIDIADQLAGTLGPVQAQESTDIADAIGPATTQVADSADTADAFGPVSAQPDDSVTVSSQLSGTLGPVIAPDSVDVSDAMEPATNQVAESVGTDDTATVTLAAPATDTFDVSDENRPVRGPQIVDTVDTMDAMRPVGGPHLLDSVDVADAYAPTAGAADDTADVADAIRPVDAPQFADSTDISDGMSPNTATVAESVDAADALRPVSSANLLESADFGTLHYVTLLTASDPEPVDFAHALQPVDLIVASGVDIADALQSTIASITSAQHWPNTVVSSSVFTNTSNFVDTSTSTQANSQVSQSGGLINPSSQNASPAITVSFPDINISFTTKTFTNVLLEYDWATSNDGGLLTSGQAVSMTPAYSLNDGSSWTNLTTITNTSGSNTESATFSLTYAQLNQLRFRWTGTITSGTVALGLGTAVQHFDVGFVRINYDITVT